MPKPTDIRLVDVTHSTERFAYRTPIKFGGRVVTDAVVVDVQATVQSRNGRRATGLGSMPMGNAWAWPSTQTSGDDTLRDAPHGRIVRRRRCDYQGSGHPSIITHDLAAGHKRAAETVERELTLAEPIPRLAQLVAASPVEAAIHDAYGKGTARTVTICSVPSSRTAIWATI